MGPTSSDTAYSDSAPRVLPPASSWAITGLTACAIALTLLLGHNVLFFTAPYPLFVGLIAGLIATVGCAAVLDATIAAAVGTGAGVVLVALIAESALGSPLDIATMALQAAALAAVVAALGALVRRSSHRLVTLFTVLVIVLSIACGWLYAMQTAIRPVPVTWATGHPGDVSSFIAALRVTPKQTADSPDATIFLALTRAVSNGDDYYRASVAILDESNRAHPGEPVPLDQSTSYRLPTLYWLLGSLPQDGISLILAGLVLQACCAVAAYLLARRHLTAPFALAACMGIAAYFAVLMPIQVLLFTEMWAGGLGLIAIALLAWALDGGKRALWLQVAAAAVALVAALTRELAVAFLLVGLVVALFDAESRARRLWIAWAVGLAAFAGIYAVHAHAIASAFQASHLASGLAASQGRLPWLHPDGKGLAASVHLGGAILGVTTAAGWVAYALGVAGSLVVPAGRSERLLLGLTVVGGTGVLAIAHTAAGSGGSGPVPGFWGMVVLPVVFACVALVFSRVPGARGSRAK